jgi:hypothetical protein
MNLMPLPLENAAIDEDLLRRFVKIHGYCKLAILSFGGAALALAAVATGHLGAVPGFGIVAAATVVGFVSARRAAALLRDGEREGASARPIAPARLREARSLG